MSDQRMTYVGSGVDYDVLDKFKRHAQQIAARTSVNAELHEMEFLEWSRGESVAIISDRRSERLIGHVHEGLGTKALVTDAMAAKLNKPDYYRSAAKDTVAMIVNDMVTLGVYPVSLAMNMSTGDKAWFKDEERYRHLLEGWGEAVHESGAVWACGETPTLPGVIMPDTCELSGSGWGVTWAPFKPWHIEDGDRIIVFESSGIHANGLTLARQLAERLPDNYLTSLPDGTTYGEALLTPTHIYVDAVGLVENLGVLPRYGMNITGHGWRKFSRAVKPWKYVLDVPIPVPPVLEFIQEQGGISNEEMYGNFNMGAGFALIVSEEDANVILEDAEILKLPFRTFIAGRVEKSDKKRIEIPWLNLAFEEDALQVRG